MDEVIAWAVGIALAVFFVLLAYLAVRAINGIDIDDDDPGGSAA